MVPRNSSAAAATTSGRPQERLRGGTNGISGVCLFHWKTFTVNPRRCRKQACLFCFENSFAKLPREPSLPPRGVIATRRFVERRHDCFVCFGSYKNLKPYGFESCGHPKLVAKSSGQPSVLLWSKKDPNSDGVADVDISYNEADEVSSLPLLSIVLPSDCAQHGRASRLMRPLVNSGSLKK